MTAVWVPLVSVVIGGLITWATNFAVAKRQERRRAATAVHEAKRIAVSRMLDVLDEVLHAQTLPPFIRRWRKPNLDLALTLHRLALGLPNEDFPVAMWAGAQVQRMLVDGSGKRYTNRAGRLQSRLVGWYRGDYSTEWFANALKDEPLQKDWKIPRLARLSAQVRDGVRDTGYVVAGSFAYGLLGKGIQPIVSRIIRRISSHDTDSE